MRDTFDIPASDFGQIRVFAVAPDGSDDLSLLLRAPEENKDQITAAVVEALGVVDTKTGEPANLDPAFVDVIRPADLEGLGLSGYLEQGVGAERDALRPDRARLDAIDSPVVIALSSAFRGRAMRMTPKPPLRWVGTWAETHTGPPPPARQFRSVTDGGVSGTMPAVPGRGSSRALRVVLFIVAIVILIAVMILLGAGP